MSICVDWSMLLVTLILLPSITLGCSGKMKAFLQNRVGAPLYQPFFKIWKLLQKQEVLSCSGVGISRVASALNLSILIVLAVIIPWLSFVPPGAGADLFFVIYLFALSRFVMLLSALESGSPLCGFGASREATLSLLVEPATVVCLSSLGLMRASSDLGQVFSFSVSHSVSEFPVWALAMLSLFLVSVVELSRMPVDDPTTHLELTMVHESMVLENSGRNLAFIEIAYGIKLTVLYGLCGQCFLHALFCFVPMDKSVLAVSSMVIILFLALVTAVLESSLVKLKWTRVPELIAYAVTLSLLSAMGVLMRTNL